MKKGILERLKDGPVLGDGGYLLELEKRGWVRAGPFTPEVALNNPEALRQLHIEFREAGAEVLKDLAVILAPGDQAAESRGEGVPRDSDPVCPLTPEAAFVHQHLADIEDDRPQGRQCNLTRKGWLVHTRAGRVPPLGPSEPG